ncbi:SigB/SigF/SigG family RNA polymerase sigma factor [Streptomyces sp. NBC_00370]|uniref:SigB/SigF/SigG family RNA polymerase sigma factor n=1 Tax=Streptomyces sp. NBC_00370 TaxID=2975728 RepID=UPI002E26D03A
MSTRMSGPSAVLVGEAAGISEGDARTGGLSQIEDAQKIAPKDARDLSKLFFDRLQALEEGTREYQDVRNTLIEMNLSLVKFAAKRFRNRADQMEDIVQVGTIGLIKAIDRFELSREVEFTTFAIPYITGEIKRFFRDTTWAVHVPRRLQVLRVELARAKDQLAVILDRDPTVRELAAHMRLTENEVIEGLIASNGYNSDSLDLPTDSSSEPRTTSLADFVGACDPAMELIEDFHSLAPLLTTLDERERLILELRFGQELTQAEIGERLGISQMHVSRILSRTLTQLRAGLLVEE